MFATLTSAQMGGYGAAIVHGVVRVGAIVGLAGVAAKNVVAK